MLPSSRWFKSVETVVNSTIVKKAKFRIFNNRLFVSIAKSASNEIVNHRDKPHCHFENNNDSKTFLFNQIQRMVVTQNKIMITLITT